jgi:hypothetical protein
MCNGEKICKKHVLRRLNEVEAAVRHVFSKCPKNASARIQLESFVKGLDHAREVVRNTTNDGTVIVRER